MYPLITISLEYVGFLETCDDVRFDSAARTIPRVPSQVELRHISLLKLLSVSNVGSEIAC